MDLQNLLKLIAMQDAAAATSDPGEGVTTQAMPIAQDFDPNYANMLEDVPGASLAPTMTPPAPEAPLAQLAPPAPKKAPSLKQPVVEAPIAPAAPIEEPKQSLEQKLPMLSSNAPDDLALALEQSRKDQNVNNILRAGNAIASGAAGYAGAKPDFTQANAVLSEADKLAAAKAGDILTKRKAEGEKVERAEKELDFTNKKNLSDPKSAESQAMREQVLSLFPEYKDMPGFKEASGKQLDDTFKFLNLKEQMEARKQIARDAAEARKEAAKEKAGEKLSKGQEARDRVGAKIVSDWFDAGNRAMIQGDIQKLKEVEAKLEKGPNISGGVLGRLPFQETVNAAGKDIQDAVSSVTQKNLRQILGGQFAQKEGEQLIKRAYDPVVTEKSNLERVRALRMAMEKAAAAKDKTSKEFMEKGTLSQQEADFSTTDASGDDAAAVARQKRIAELKAKQGKQ